MWGDACHVHVNVKIGESVLNKQIAQRQAFALF
jgi:hypothetical protein